MGILKSNLYKKARIYFLALLVIFLALNFIFLSQNSKGDFYHQAYVSIVFDDGYSDNYYTAFPILKRYNLTATEYVIAGKINHTFENSSLMNLNQLKELYTNGWEIGSHTLNHYSLIGLSQEEIENETKNSKLLLNAYGFNVSSLAIPYGYCNESILETAKKYYSTIRLSKPGFNVQKSDKFHLKTLWKLKEDKVEDVKFWIDKASKDKSWLILMFHHIENSTNEYSVNANDFEEILKYIKNSEIVPVRISDVRI